MYCRNCGSIIEQGQIFCGKCGAKNENNMSQMENPVTQMFQSGQMQQPNNINNTQYQTQTQYMANNNYNQKPKKKKFLYIILGIILTLLISGGVLFLFLNKEKESMTASEFKSFMKDEGYDVVDISDQYSQYGYIEKAYIALSSDESYQIEFYEISNEEYAIKAYNKNKSNFEDTKSSSSAETDVNGKNYSKYTLSTGGKYKVVSRIDNTVIYLDVDSDYKAEVKDILKELGY